MGKFSSRVQQLRQVIRRFEVTAAVRKQDLIEIGEEVAELLIQAIWDARHPFSQDLQELSQRVELDQQGQLFRTEKRGPQAYESEKVSRNPHRHFFMPQPGMGGREHRQYWPLQLLLAVAAGSARCAARVADFLKLSPAEMAQAVEEASKISIRMWGLSKWLAHLGQAVELLDHGLPLLSFRLDGTTVRHSNGAEAELTRQEASFLKFLIDRVEHRVTYDQFADDGIDYPPQTKHKVMQKLASKGIEIRIETDGRNAYILREDE